MHHHSEAGLHIGLLFKVCLYSIEFDGFLAGLGQIV